MKAPSGKVTGPPYRVIVKVKWSPISFRDCCDTHWGLEQQTFLPSLSSGGHKSKIKVSQSVLSLRVWLEPSLAFVASGSGWQSLAGRGITLVSAQSSDGLLYVSLFSLLIRTSVIALGPP